MKSSSMNTHMGNISIDNEVIAQYAGSVAMECFGIVGMAGINVRDGLRTSQEGVHDKRNQCISDAGGQAGH